MVPIRQDLVSAEKYGVKCPHSMKAEGITVHNTANNAPAKNEITYMKNNNNQVSFHYAIDDVEIVQGISEDRNAWHAGDGNGTGNRKTIGIEICYSTGDKAKFEKSQENAAEFVAYKLKEYGWSVDKVYTHKHWSGKHCPHRTLDEYGWDYFINLVKKYMGEEVVTTKEMYRVRKAWADSKSQIGAYTILENAKKACKEGYYVFDSKGNIVFPEKEIQVAPPTPVKKSNTEIAQEVIAGKWGNGATRKTRLQAAGYDYNAVQAEVERLMKKPEPPKPVLKSIDVIAAEVMAGKWGNGDARKKALTEAGYDYAAIQAAVNKLAKGESKPAPKPVLKTNAEIAKEVMAGKWGNGDARKKALESAGYNYAAIQAEVNKLAGGGSTGYKVQITASALNVRAGAGTSYKIVKVVRKGQIYTIVSEKSGWGKLSDGSGWISLSYTKRV